MSTAHRGLPPPAAMALPVPSASPSLGQLPDRWQHGSDDTQRTWLQAKSEEEKRRQEEERRRQEEERTRQENFRLEIRRTELEMLREAFRGGMPPHLVPVIFTGGGALAGTSAEWANQYIAQLNQNTHQLSLGQHPNTVSPPDSRMETRLLTASEHQTPQSTTMSSISRTPAQSILHHHPSSSHPTPGSSHNLPSHPSSGSSHPGPASHTQSYSSYSAPGLSPARHHSQQIHHSELPRSSLPRINTDEMQVQPPPPGPSPGSNMQLSGVPSHLNGTPSHAPPQHSSVQSHSTAPPLPPSSHPEAPRQAESSPIYFHHWQPPSTQTTTSATPMASTSPASVKNVESPFAHQSYLSGNENSHSLKKRKTMGGTQSYTNSPAGSTVSQQANSFSPSFSPGSSANANKRRGVSTPHNRNRSDSGSTRGYEPYAKSAASRPRRTDGGSSFNETGGNSGHFSISHMTTQDESPELAHREMNHQSQGGSHESQVSHQHFSAGPDMRRESQHHLEREGSISHGPPSQR